jgi:Ser/Thr protein kinase RdoA (MazF antagonist)
MFRWIPSAVDTLVDVAKRPGSKFQERINKEGAKAQLAQAFAEAANLVAPSDKYFNCVCHGDIWNNNMMFRYA